MALAEDPEKGWEQMAPYFLHETNAYGAWQARDDVASPFHSVADSARLRATGQYRVLTPEQFVAEQKASAFPFAQFHPLCGGCRWNRPGRACACSSARYCPRSPDPPT